MPSTRAYNHSMASDHDLAGRPPVIAVSNGESRTLIRKEAPSDLLIRDIGLLKESSVHHTLYVPVRISDAGLLTLRTGRLESGERIGMAFTSKEALSFTLGSAQQWVNLGDQSLRGMLAPLGIQHLRIDPLPLGQPGTAGIPHQARKRPGPHTYSPVTTAHTTAWAVAFRSLSQHYWQRPAP